jgi:Family of unknown function (DUF6401)
MPGLERSVPLSAVALRLTDEVGQAVLDRVAAGDLAAAAELDQHVAAVRAELAPGRPDQPPAARDVAGPARTATLTAGCPDVPFADSPWHADALPAVRLLLHYACGFIEAAVRADWWPANPAVGYEIEWQALRLAAVCQLIRRAEATAALPPDLR